MRNLAATLGVSSPMRRAGLVLITALVLGCTVAPPSEPTGFPSPTASATVSRPPTASPSATLDTSLFGALPEGIAGLPLGGGPTAEIAPETERTLSSDPAVGHSYELGHCGLLGPLDFDGSLWVPQGAHNGVGGALSRDQLGELLNATRVRLFLLDEQHALLVTPLNGFVLLARHEGARDYGLCD